MFVILCNSTPLSCENTVARKAIPPKLVIESYIALDPIGRYIIISFYNELYYILIPVASYLFRTS